MALQEAVAEQVERIQLLLELQQLVADRLQVELQIQAAEQEAHLQAVLLSQEMVVAV
jgi:hypothetical protein